jgi:MoxR-like ATPase
VGTDIYQAEHEEAEFRPGPLFHNILLADEINRAPPKVQAALLEAMAEKQVTVGQHTHKLPRFFVVFATQNSVEHEGTYNLPEAQLDRFLLYVRVSYPSRKDELEIVSLTETSQTSIQPFFPPISQQDIYAAREAVMQVHVDNRLKEYMVDIVRASRDPGRFDKNLQQLQRWQRFGASPRAGIALNRCARALAWLHGKCAVSFT